jgi:hypothetical protein
MSLIPPLALTLALTVAVALTLATPADLEADMAGTVDEGRASKVHRAMTAFADCALPSLDASSTRSLLSQNDMFVE